VCCSEIRIGLSANGQIEYVDFVGGCEGNHRGIASLLVGQNGVDVIGKLLGIDCDGRGTSCPDQLAKALQAALKA